jgi:Zn-finger nucleic acid-binding protein
VIYRDQHERCPRCSAELIDARAARACPDCGGLWVDEATVTEMVTRMLPPRPFSTLVLAVLDRDEPPIACPSCGAKMEPTSIHGVALDWCRKHGLWFDAQELEIALQRVADPDLPPPVSELAVAPGDAPDGLVPPGWLRFVVETPGHAARTLTLKGVVRIGRMKSSQIHIEGDDQVSRMHALIGEVPDEGGPWLIDLGSSSGTYVSGERVEKIRIRSGDRIGVGKTTLSVSFVETPSE